MLVRLSKTTPESPTCDPRDPEDRDSDIIFDLEMDNSTPIPAPGSTATDGDGTLRPSTTSIPRAEAPRADDPRAEGLTQGHRRGPTMSSNSRHSSSAPATLRHDTEEKAKEDTAKQPARPLDARAEAFLAKVRQYQVPAPQPSWTQHSTSHAGPSSAARGASQPIYSSRTTAYSSLSPHAHEVHQGHRYVTGRGYGRSLGPAAPGGGQQRQQQVYSHHSHVVPQTTGWYQPVPYQPYQLQQPYYGYYASPGVVPLYGSAGNDGSPAQASWQGYGGAQQNKGTGEASVSKPGLAIVSSRPLIVDGSKHNYDMELLNRFDDDPPHSASTSLSAGASLPSLASDVSTLTAQSSVGDTSSVPGSDSTSVDDQLGKEHRGMTHGDQTNALQDAPVRDGAHMTGAGTLSRRASHALTTMPEYNHWLLKLPAAFWQRLMRYVDNAALVNLSTIHRIFAHARVERVLRNKLRASRLLELEERAAFATSQLDRLLMTPHEWYPSHKPRYAKACFHCYNLRQEMHFPRVFTHPAPLDARQAPPSLPLFVPYIPVPSDFSTRVSAFPRRSRTTTAVQRSGDAGALPEDVSFVDQCCFDCAVEAGLIRAGERIVAMDGSWRWVCQCGLLHFGAMDGYPCSGCNGVPY